MVGSGKGGRLLTLGSVVRFPAVTFFYVEINFEC